MSRTFRLSCTACTFHQQSADAITMVVKDDGTEAICPEPGTIRIAEETTHRIWNDLVDAGRIRERHAFICLACGANDFYAGEPSVRAAARQACRSCGKTGLYPIAGAARILPFFHLGLPRCPVCKEGRLVSECVREE